MAFSVYSGGSWKPVKKLSVFKGGVWKPVKKLSVYRGGAWRLVADYTTPPTPTLSVYASPASAFKSGTTPTMTTNIVSASASGGVPPYSYAWALLSGSDTRVTINAPTNASTTFKITGIAPGETVSVTARCTVTDASGAHGSVDVPVNFFNTNNS